MYGLSPRSRRRVVPFGVAAAAMLLLGGAMAVPAVAQSPSASAASAPAPPLPVPASEYRALVTRARKAAEDGVTQAEGSTLTRDFQRVKRVQADDGQILTVKTSETVARITKAAGKPKTSGSTQTVTAHLRSLEETVRVPDVWKDGDTAFLAPDANAQAAKILSGKEYRHLDSPRHELTWWDNFWKSVGDAISRFFRWLFGSFRGPGNAPDFAGFGRIVLNVLYFVAAIAALVGLYFLGRFLYEKYGGTVVRRTRSGAATGLDLADEIADPLGEAHTLAAGGDLRGAVRFAYIAALRRLRDSGLLVFEKNKTNWEYQRSLRSRSSDAYNVLLPATRLFDFVWYGGREPSRDEFESVIRAYNALPDTPPAPAQTKSEKSSVATAPNRPASAPNPAAAPSATKPAPPQSTTPQQPPPARPPGSGNPYAERKDNPW